MKQLTADEVINLLVKTLEKELNIKQPSSLGWKENGDLAVYNGGDWGGDWDDVVISYNTWCEIAKEVTEIG